MKIAYLSRINFFSDKAHVHTMAKTCEALDQEQGINLTLVSTDNSLKDRASVEAFFRKHDVDKLFAVVSLPSLANIWKNSSNFFIYNLSTIWANFSLINFVWKNRKNIDIVYFRDHLILPVVFFAKYMLHKKVVYESHYILTKSFGQWLAECSVGMSDAVIAIAVALKEYYEKYNKNIVVSFCASSDKEKFKTNENNLYFKNKLGLPSNKYFLVYTGNIDVTGNGDSYGVEDVVKALPYMSEDTMFIAIGKRIQDTHPLEKLAESLNVAGKFLCVPWVSRDKVIHYILATDVLIIPKSGAKPGNSPTKMFEYLGTQRPIIAADTLPIKEVLRDTINASLVNYASPQDWADKVAYMRTHPDYIEHIVNQAYIDADLYTWPKRAQTIVNVLKNLYYCHV